MKPNAKKLVLRNVYDGNEMVEYIANKLKIDENDVWKVFYECFIGDDGCENILVNIIVEDEWFCNDEGIRYDIFRTINEDFGEDIIVSFLPDYVIEWDGGYIKDEI